MSIRVLYTFSFFNVHFKSHAMCAIIYTHAHRHNALTAVHILYVHAYVYNYTHLKSYIIALSSQHPDQVIVRRFEYCTKITTTNLFANELERKCLCVMCVCEISWFPKRAHIYSYGGLFLFGETSCINNAQQSACSIVKRKTQKY